MFYIRFISKFLFLLFLCIDVFPDEVDYYSPENLLRFADHLYQQGDYVRSIKEYERYMFSCPNNPDEALYKIGICYRYADDIDKAIDAFQRIVKENPNSNLKFSANFQIGYSYFISGQYKNSQDYTFGLLKDELTSDQLKKLHILLALNYLGQRKWQLANNILNISPSGPSNDQNIDRIMSDLRRLSSEGITRKHKSRFWASFMSAIIPGAGKIYCGQYGNGLFSFMTVSSVGFIAYSGFKRDGIKSVRGWIFGSLFPIFYFGNIYGSGISALAYNDCIESKIITRLPKLPDDW